MAVPGTNHLADFSVVGVVIIEAVDESAGISIPVTAEILDAHGLHLQVRKPTNHTCKLSRIGTEEQTRPTSVDEPAQRSLAWDALSRVAGVSPQLGAATIIREWLR